MILGFEPARAMETLQNLGGLGGLYGSNTLEQLAPQRYTCIRHSS